MGDEKIVGEFALTLLHSVTNVRTHHWLIIDKSNPQHQALGMYCDKMPALIDGLIESLMGDPADFIPEFPADYYAPAANGIAEINDILQYVKENRHTISEETDIQNQIDEMVTLIKKVRYLLRSP